MDNQGYPEGLRKRPETTYIQTWHGSAFKLMGLDQPRVKSGPAAQRDKLRRMVERYDCFLVRSGHDAETLCAASGSAPSCSPVYYPRNDPLVNGVNGDPELAAEVASLRASLGLDDGRRAVLYAPTFTTGPKGRPVKLLDPPIDPEVFARELGEGTCCSSGRTTCARPTSRPEPARSCGTSAECPTSPRCCCSRTR